MATMRTPIGVIVIGVTPEEARAAGAQDFMRPTHRGFRTEGLAVGHAKRMAKQWPGTRWFVTANRAAARPRTGELVHGLWCL